MQIKPRIPQFLKHRHPRGRSLAASAWGIGFLAAVCHFATPTAAASPQDNDLAVRAIRLIKTECLACHGAEEQEGGLRLDTPEHLAAGGDSGAAISAESPDQSPLLLAIRQADGVSAMPPKKPLSPAAITLLEEWVAAGTRWPEDPLSRSNERTRSESDPQSDDHAMTDAESTESGDTVHRESGDAIGDAWSDERNPVLRTFGPERLQLWSLQPMRDSSSPQLGEHPTATTRNPIDAYVQLELQSVGIPAATEADPRTLLRRVTFDLIGLPPSPSEVEAFAQDSRPDAFERQVDRLLASVQHGQHVARSWLDVVRYSDSNGFDWDEFRPQAWRFRDYVVDAMNRDLAYDRFVTEQLAGDELVGPQIETDDDLQAWIATGYLRLGPHDNAAKLFDEQDRSRTELMQDLVETTTAAFLGQTYSCCRCHDHKTEPFLQADHYRMRAFFEGVEFADDRPLETRAQREAREAIEQTLDAEWAEVEAKRQEILVALRDQWKQAQSQVSQSSDSQETQAEGDSPREPSEADEPSEEALLEFADEATREALATLSAEQQAIEARRPRPVTGMMMTETSGEIDATFVLYQGDHKAPREEVGVGFPSLWDPANTAVNAPLSGTTSGRRSTLAEWIVAPDHPWTYRVAANRVWQSLFGTGLVETANDFGISGATPSHPALLDRLALDLVRAEGSLKNLRRRMVVSATYRQNGSFALSASERDRQELAWSIDPDLRLLWRFPTKRLTAEQLRDSILEVAGALDQRVGGAPIWPELPADILQANPAFLDDNETRTKGWYPSPEADRRARSLYWVQKRTVRIPFQETFDLPENNVSCAARGVSIVPPQALTLLNGDLMQEASDYLAQAAKHDALEQTLSDGDDVSADESKVTSRLIQAMYQRALQRFPTEAEVDACREFLSERELPELARVLLNVAEFAAVE